MFFITFKSFNQVTYIFGGEAQYQVFIVSNYTDSPFTFYGWAIIQTSMIITAAHYVSDDILDAVIVPAWSINPFAKGLLIKIVQIRSYTNIWTARRIYYFTDNQPLNNQSLNQCENIYVRNIYNQTKTKQWGINLN